MSSYFPNLQTAMRALGTEESSGILNYYLWDYLSFLHKQFSGICQSKVYDQLFSQLSSLVLMMDLGRQLESIATNH